jgi:hypothetical protein
MSLLPGYRLVMHVAQYLRARDFPPTTLATGLLPGDY